LLLSQGELLADGPSKPVTDLYHKLMYSDAQTIAGILADLRRHGLNYVLNYTQLEAWLTEQRRIEPVQGANSARQPDRNNLPAPGQEPSDWFDPNMPKTAEVVYGNGDAQIMDYGIYNEQGQPVNVLVMGRRYKWVYLVKFYREAHNVQFGMMVKTIDGLEVAGVASRLENCHIAHIPAATTVEASFSITLNVAPGTYFLNAGVDSYVNGVPTYLHRRVDICMIRVLAHDSRHSYGIAYLAPQFEYTLKSEFSPLAAKRETL
jgi:lipopolysaccharide transport system ATP-binding protein